MVMVLGLIVVLITGTVQVGGVGNIIDLLEKGNRDQFFDVGIDPTIRHSVWAIMIGGVFQAVYTSGVNQLVVQRNLSCKSEQGATFSAWIGVIGVSLTRLLASACGVVMFAYYVDCDPVDAGRIMTRDQIMPLFIVDLFGHIRGLSGLILSAIFSASLSTVSSGVNAVSANISEDFIKPHFKYSEACITLITKLIAAVCGVIATSLAYVAPLFGSNILEAALAFVGVLSGPLLGVFSLGMFLPHCNSTGAMSGLVSGAVLGYFFLVSSFLLPLPLTDQLGYLNYNCSDVMSNFTMLETTTSYVTTPVLNDDYDLPMWFLQLCNVSYMYYGCFTCILTIVVGMIVSLLTGPMEPASLNRDLFCPLVDAFFCCLPKTCTKRCCSSVGKNYEAKVAGYVNDAYEVEANGHVTLPTPASELFVNEQTSETRL
ncbi:hypothetical protein BSL78_07498 [Apostichopus japonicus]|uniref:Sodium-coupled monocarboxylate transporter 1 n=1 Tax=Stichopus japonicus TaxID=307972 RepID=A0A2G8L5R2_STIJA|nr:hypothetical protein BSL78_07498 [Apostichopus japonicus]